VSATQYTYTHPLKVIKSDVLGIESSDDKCIRASLVISEDLVDRIGLRLHLRLCGKTRYMVISINFAL
jgi:hypothetical protein